MGTHGLGWILVLFLASFGRAHEGPPYQVIVDEPHGPWMVTLWADPDVGQGTFWVQLEETGEHAAPSDTRVHLTVAPSSDPTAEQRVLADPEAWGTGQSHVALVDFPTREFWTVRVELDSASAGAHAECGVSVEVTPPGFGTFDLLLYSWPFLAMGLLWMRALQKQRALQRSHDEQLAAEPPASG